MSYEKKTLLKLDCSPQIKQKRTSKRSLSHHYYQEVKYNGTKCADFCMRKVDLKRSVLILLVFIS